MPDETVDLPAPVAQTEDERRRQSALLGFALVFGLLLVIALIVALAGERDDQSAVDSGVPRSTLPSTDGGPTSTQDVPDDPPGVDRSETGSAVRLSYVEAQAGESFGDDTVEAEPTTSQFELIATESGSYRFAISGEGDAYSYSGYDAARLVSWNVFDDGDGPTGSQTVASGSILASLPFLFQRSTVAAIALADDYDAIVDPATGRAVVEIDEDLSPNLIGGGPDHITGIFDVVTGLPIAIEETLAGQPYRMLTLIDGDWAADVDNSTFDAPRSDQVFHDGVDVVTDPAKVMGDGFPTLPDAIDGFELAVTQAAVDADVATGVEGSNPPADEVVIGHYRAPWRSYTVALLGYDDIDGYGFSNPLFGEGSVQTEIPFDVEGGRYDGLNAAAVFEPGVEQSIWVTDGSVAAVVAGDLDVLGLRSVLASIS